MVTETGYARSEACKGTEVPEATQEADNMRGSLWSGFPKIKLIKNLKEWLERWFNG